MGKVHLQDLDRYEEEVEHYKPIKTNKKKKPAPIYNKDFPDELES
jgi:hypothetical protein